MARAVIRVKGELEQDTLHRHLLKFWETKEHERKCRNAELDGPETPWDYLCQMELIILHSLQEQHTAS